MVDPPESIQPPPRDIEKRENSNSPVNLGENARHFVWSRRRRLTMMMMMVSCLTWSVSASEAELIVTYYSILTLPVGRSE